MSRDSCSHIIYPVYFEQMKGIEIHAYPNGCPMYTLVCWEETIKDSRLVRNEITFVFDRHWIKLVSAAMRSAAKRRIL